MKLCPRCGEQKPLSEFHMLRRSADGKNPYCKSCMNERQAQYRTNHLDRIIASNFKALNGITPEIYAALFKSQGGRCAICRTNEPGGRGRFCIDHDHACCAGSKSCGRCVRGLLCTQCNVMLGMAKDDTDRLRSAVDYLQAPQPEIITKAPPFPNPSCHQGHEYAADNVYRRSNRPDWRGECRACVLEMARIYRSIPEVREARRQAEQLRRDRRKLAS